MSAPRNYDVYEKIIAQHKDVFEKELKEILPFFAASFNESNTKQIFKKIMQFQAESQKFFVLEKRGEAKEETKGPLMDHVMDGDDKVTFYHVLNQYFFQSLKLSPPVLNTSMAYTWFASVEILQDINHSYRCGLESLVQLGIILNLFLGFLNIDSPEEKMIESKKAKIKEIIERAAIMAINPSLQATITKITIFEETLKKQFAPPRRYALMPSLSLKSREEIRDYEKFLDALKIIRRESSGEEIDIKFRGIVLQCGFQNEFETLFPEEKSTPTERKKPYL